MTHIPTIGRTVLYVLPEGHNNPGQLRPAVVVQTWADTPDAAVNLHVFIDPSNDEPVDPMQQCSVAHDPAGKQPRSDPGLNQGSTLDT